MSNIVVGDAFDKIIAEVVQASQTDFEENGVSQQTLLELKQTWQQKLSARNIATMPWDPKPVAPPPSNGSMAAASNGHKYSAPPSQVSQPSVQRVKPEPATDATYDNSNFLPPTMNPELAHQRAQNLIAQQYGNQASASLNAMQQQQRGIALPGQAPKPMGLQLPGQTPQVLQQQYAQQLKQQQAAQEPRIKAETDGAAEYASDAEASHAWQALMAERRQITADDITRNESMMRDHIAQMTADFESGLMQPLNSKSLQNKSRRQKQIRKGMSSVPQLDGEFSDDEKPIKEDEDENAINSDLDDSGDEQANADDDDDEMDSMLCTYDKVQRVKNKWKCTLKDGVLAANGKELVTLAVLEKASKADMITGTFSTKLLASSSGKWADALLRTADDQSRKLAMVLPKSWLDDILEFYCPGMDGGKGNPHRKLP